jgi:hypothetical protein
MFRRENPGPPHFPGSFHLNEKPSVALDSSCEPVGDLTSAFRFQYAAHVGIADIPLDIDPFCRGANMVPARSTGINGLGGIYQECQC